VSDIFVCSSIFLTPYFVLQFTVDSDYSDDEVFEDTTKIPAKAKFLAGLGGEKPGELAKIDTQLNQKCWYPIFFQFVSKDTEHTEHQILLIVMPSGVATNNLAGVSMEVEDEGWTFHLTVKVPELATNVNSIYTLLERHWEETGYYYPNLDGFRIRDALEDHLAKLRKKVTEKLVCEARFSLEISVSKKIHEIQILGDREQSTRILYVDLKGDESEYKAVTDAKVTM
jgi:hypothetical protein